MDLKQNLQTHGIKLIGICGQAGSGKDTISDLFESHGFTKIAFADPIKRSIMDWYGFSEEQVFGPSEFRNKLDKKVNLTPRFVLQTIGTEIARQIDELTWVNYAMRVVDILLNNRCVHYCQRRGVCHSIYTSPRIGVIISDVRFINEINNIKKHGGKVIKIVRDGSGLSGSSGKHQSENEMLNIPNDCFDLVIDNNGTLMDLKKTVYDFVSNLK
jgi:dephospho-CoA kinase